jgi:hypothetical protein
MIKKVTFSKRTGRFKSGQPASKKIKEEGAREYSRTYSTWKGSKGGFTEINRLLRKYVYASGIGEGENRNTQVSNIHLFKDPLNWSHSNLNNPLSKS